MQSRSTRNRNKYARNKSSHDNYESATSPLHLQEVTPTAVPNVIPTRPVEKHVGTSLQAVEETIPVTTEILSLLEAILGQDRRHAFTPSRSLSSSRTTRSRKRKSPSHQCLGGARSDLWGPSHISVFPYSISSISHQYSFRQPVDRFTKWRSTTPVYHSPSYRDDNKKLKEQ